MPEGKIDQLQFVSSVGHDLKTPLVFIKGAAGQVLAADLPAEEKMKRLRQVEQSADRLLKLIDSAIAATQAASGQVELSLEPVHAAEIAAEAVADIRPYAAELGFAFTVKTQRSLPPVLTHRASLQRIVFNLLDNAVKYTQGRRDIQVRAVRDGPHHVRISVRDWGAGVSPADLKRIFKLFGRAGPPANGLGGSSGLGLFIASDLSQRLSAELSVAAHATGSSFFVRLPVARQLSLFA